MSGSQPIAPSTRSRTNTTHFLLWPLQQQYLHLSRSAAFEQYQPSILSLHLVIASIVSFVSVEIDKNISICSNSSVWSGSTFDSVTYVSPHIMSVVFLKAQRNSWRVLTVPYSVDDSLYCCQVIVGSALVNRVHLHCTHAVCRTEQTRMDQYWICSDQSGSDPRNHLLGAEVRMEPA